MGGGEVHYALWWPFRKIIILIWIRDGGMEGLPREPLPQSEHP